ncbi:MAG: helix-turn-helix domain-containing protein [Chloroflexaceae bacterium]|nr:helix-turn-helix domain-containing protein [Chloroflexaceae bacterium]NJO07248.1 helix-turn-helix domain-containing protein [Chloroflexaceae bacterium]
MPARKQVDQPVYISLSEASRRLGVHATTLRRWADAGSVPVYVTPGGHRRFALSDIENLRERRPLQGEALVDTWASHALAQTRSELRRGDQHPAWLSTLDEQERVVWRHVSMRLMGVVLRFVSARPEEEASLLAEAQAIGDDYARHALRLHLPLTTSLEAALFFRDSLVDAAMELPEQASLHPAASGRLLRRISQILNVVQLAVVQGYETGA